MVKISIRLVGAEKDKLIKRIDVDPQVHVDELVKIVETATYIPPLFQQILFQGEELSDSMHPLQGIKDFDQLVVKHSLLLNWETYLQMINVIKRMTSSGVTEGRKKIALEAREHLSPLADSKFFLVYPTLHLKALGIANEVNFLIHNTKKYLCRSVLAYFEALHPENKVELKDKPEGISGVHIGMFVYIDDVPVYYAKTLSGIPGSDEEIDFPNRPTIDLLEIFVYMLLKLIGLGPPEVHVVPDVNKSELVFIATKIIEGFRTASGLSTTLLLTKDETSEAAETVVIDCEMRRQIKILSSLLCLSDLRRNKGNFGVVEKPLAAGKIQTKELRIVDFGVNIGQIDNEPSILSSETDIPFLKTYFEKWDFGNNVFKAKNEMQEIPALKNNKNVNRKTFDRYFVRLETALRNFSR